MPRRLGGENTLKIKDNVSKDEIHLYYRIPESEEIVAYRNECLVREGDDLVNKTIETRLKYGKKILTGFRDGDFEIKVDGKWVALTTDHKDWKEQVEKQAADLLEELGAHAFESSCARNLKKEGKDLEGN